MIEYHVRITCDDCVAAAAESPDLGITAFESVLPLSETQRAARMIGWDVTNDTARCPMHADARASSTHAFALVALDEVAAIIRKARQALE